MKQGSLRSHAILIVIVFITLVSAAPVNAQAFKNCQAIRKKYPNGIAINFRVIGTSNAEINRSIYLKNQRLDRDKDGLICEYEFLQSIGMTTTTTTTPKTPLNNLQGFVDTYGKSVVTVICNSAKESAQGSGVSVVISFSAEQKAFGWKSWIVTNHHVIEKCTTGDWRSRIVTIKAAGIEYIGYVWNYGNKNVAGKDIATIAATEVIPPVSSIFGLTRPQIGDAVIAIGTTGGIAGTTTQGAIAGVSDTELLATTPAGFGASGGALFNKSGQLIGLIQGAVGLLLSAIPVTKFCGEVYGSSGPCADGNPWKG